MCTPARPEVRPRLVVGAVLLTLGVLGIWHLLAGAPRRAGRLARAAGAVGYVAAAPLVNGLSAWVAVPVLVLVVVYGLLVITGTPVRELPARIRRLRGFAEEPAEDPTMTPSQRSSPRRCRRWRCGGPPARRQASMAEPAEPSSLPSGPRATGAERPGRGRRPRRPRGGPAAESAGSDAQYELPPPDLLGAGAAPKAAQPGQRRHDRGDHRRARPVQHRRPGHRVHPRPDRDPLRGGARPGGQGREDHPAVPQHRLRGGHRQRPAARPDPRQVRGRHRGAQHRPGDGPARRRAAQPRPRTPSTTRW